MLFEVTLVGYNGSTDKTDHLVKWVKAESLEVLNDWLKTDNLESIVQSVTEIFEYKNQNLSYEDGVDVIITEDSKLDSWHQQVVEYLDLLKK